MFIPSSSSSVRTCSVSTSSMEAGYAPAMTRPGMTQLHQSVGPRISLAGGRGSAGRAAQAAAPCSGSSRDMAPAPARCGARCRVSGSLFSVTICQLRPVLIGEATKRLKNRSTTQQHLSAATQLLCVYKALFDGCARWAVDACAAEMQVRADSMHRFTCAMQYEEIVCAGLATQSNDGSGADAVPRWSTCALTVLLLIPCAFCTFLWIPFLPMSYVLARCGLPRV